MTVLIDPQINDFSKSMEMANRIDHNVVLAHWMSEHPLDSLKNWQDVGNNPAGIRPGNSLVDSMAIGTKPADLSPNGFLKFVSPLRGFQAYATLLMKDSNYVKVREAIATGDPKKELASIAASGWDAGHYGGDGSKLFANYAAITGDSSVKTFTDQGAVATADPTTTAGKALDTAETAKASARIGSDLMKFLGLDNVNFYQVGIVVLGSIGVLVILLMLVVNTKEKLT